MTTSPPHPGAESEVDEETRKIILERLATVNEDEKTAVDAREALADIRKNLLKHPAPR